MILYSFLARISHQVSSRGRRGAVPGGIIDRRGAQSYWTVGTSRCARTGGNAEGVRPRRGLAWARRARRCEKMPLGAVHLRPQQEAGGICGFDTYQSSKRRGWATLYLGENWMTAAALTGGRRIALDTLVQGMLDPCFIMLYRRTPSAPLTSGHVNPSLLQLMPPRSRYVSRWRRHARNCHQCAVVFQSLGLKVK